jgi:DNA mismatch repair protein MutH
MTANVPLPYDKTDPISIEAHAKKLLNTTLRKVVGEKAALFKMRGKGGMGQLVELLHFKYRPNSESEPDFPEAGVELKVAPLKETRNGYSPKERIVLNIINFKEEHARSFETSSFWRKNALLLLMFYLFDRDVEDIDRIFKLIGLWDFPKTDLKIIRDDWNKIVRKIREGRAHEISEGDTLYLGACTKGKDRTSTRVQPFSDVPAMQRAFSLKTTYVQSIIRKWSNIPLDTESAVKSIRDYRKGETFEELIVKRFKPFYGKSEKELVKELGLSDSGAKNRYYLIAKAIMGVSRQHVEEFVKAGVEMKTIRLEKSGALKESMSFAQIKYKEIVNEEWEESYWHGVLTKRFFFVIFNKDAAGDLRLHRVKFWSMPWEDLKTAQRFWEDTKAKIIKGDYKHFLKISDDMICHVRPKGVDSNDRMETPQGDLQKKKCYWLNASYIKRVLNS